MNIPASIHQQLSKHKILILGLGREGVSTYRFLRQILPEIVLAVADQQPLTELTQDIQKLLEQDKRLETYLGEKYLEQLTQYDLIFKTPGIPASLTPVKQAITTGSTISSNLQLFFDVLEAIKNENKEELLVQVAKKSSSLIQPVIIGITGTKGKSTTASLIHHVLKENGQESQLVGNIGQPALDKIYQITSKGKVVIEMSSHQLAELRSSPDIAVVQNITSEHLDYFADTKAYLQSKEAIAKYQKVNQYIIFNPQHQTASNLAQLSPANQLKFVVSPSATNSSSDILVYLKSHYLTFRADKMEEQIIQDDNIPLLGKHNLENVAPAIIVGKLFGLNSAQVQQAIASFQPLAHRLEKVAVIDGVTYINDSLATMPDAAISALSCFADQGIVLLAGGHERQQSFVQLAQKIVESKVKALALFPANGERLLAEVKRQLQLQGSSKIIPARIVGSMKQAMEYAQQFVENGDAVLLSPGAASFGMFKDYADRGDQFKELVQEMEMN